MRGKQSLLLEVEWGRKTHPLQCYCCHLHCPHGASLSCHPFLAIFLDCDHWARTDLLVQMPVVFPIFKTLQCEKKSPVAVRTPWAESKAVWEGTGGPSKVWSRTFYQWILCCIAFWVPYILVFFLLPKVLITPCLFLRIYSAECCKLYLPPPFLLLFLIAKPSMTEEERKQDNSWISLAKPFLTPWFICLASRCGYRVTVFCFVCIPGHLHQPFVGLFYLCRMQLRDQPWWWIEYHHFLCSEGGDGDVKVIWDLVIHLEGI